MKRYFENLAKALLNEPFSELEPTEKKVIESIASNSSIAENVNHAFYENTTFGQRVADRVATFGGSWTFIGIFFFFIATWIFINTAAYFSEQPFDPYPYILLNLGLSTLAAFQAPIIMMSQNRQAAKDRIKMDAAYEVNLKLELEIMQINNKLDQLLKQKQENFSQDNVAKDSSSLKNSTQESASHGDESP